MSGETCGNEFNGGVCELPAGHSGLHWDRHLEHDRGVGVAWRDRPLTFRRLPSGYWHIRGSGPCNWTQPPAWPTSEESIRAHAFPQASEEFLRAVVRAVAPPDGTEVEP